MPAMAAIQHYEPYAFAGLGFESLALGGEVCSSCPHIGKGARREIDPAAGECVQFQCPLHPQNTGETELRAGDLAAYTGPAVVAQAAYFGLVYETNYSRPILSPGVEVIQAPAAWAGWSEVRREGEEYEPCAECGGDIVSGATTSKSGEEFCAACAYDVLVPCEYCRGLAREGEMFGSVGRRGGTGWICESCADDGSEAFCCDDCGHWFDESEAHSGPDGEGAYCEDCFDESYTRCDCRRGTVVVNEDALYVEGRGYVCGRCAEGYSSCDNCGELCHYEDMHSDHQGGVYCSDCHREDDDSPEAVHSSDYTPEDMCLLLGAKEEAAGVSSELHRVPQGMLTLGMELEVSFSSGNKYGAAEDIGPWGEGWLYMKEDGSLSNGIEFVSWPFTWGWWREFGRGWYTELCKRAAKHGGKAFDASCSCGVHIHIGRQSFDDAAHLYRFVSLWYAVENRRALQCLAQRGDSTYASYDEAAPAPRKAVPPWGTKKGALAVGPARDGKYQAINTGHTGTVEVRVFKATLKPETLLAYPELVRATWAYSRKYGAADMKNWAKFRQFVANNGASYRLLVKYMDRRGV